MAALCWQPDPYASPDDGNGYPFVLCTIAHGMSRAESDSLAQQKIWKKSGSASLPLDQRATPVIELEDRKCAT